MLWGGIRLNKFLRNVGFYLLIILVAITVIDHFSVDTSNKQEINYTEFVKQVDDKNVAKVVMQNSNIKGTWKMVQNLQLLLQDIQIAMKNL